MAVNKTIWREPVARFEGLNVRSGASDLSDIDYINFPPNYLCTYDTYEQYPDLLWNFVDAGNLSLDEPIEESICYVGMKNPDLPQLNYTSHGRYGFYDENNPFYITDNTQVQGVFFVATGNISQFSGQIEWEGNALYNENYTYALGYKYRRYNGEKGQASYISPQSNSNSNLFLNVYQKIGIKNFIFEIRVQYKTGINQYGVTAAETTLAGYVSQTTEWKQQHPIVSAYGIPYWRYDTNGEYRHNGQTGVNKNITAAFTLPFIYSGSNPQESYSSIYNYAINYSSNTTCGYLPIYGSRGDHSEPKAVAQDHGKVGVLIGANKGTYHYSFSSGYNNMWLELDGSDDDNIEWLRRGMAAYGLFFCDEIGTLWQSGKDLTRWIDDKMCLGTIDDNGYTNGDYTHGLDNSNQRQFDWKETDKTNYNPTKPPGENTYSNITTFNDISNIATLTRRYALSKSAVEALGAALWQISSDIINNIPNNEWNKYSVDVLDTFLTSNPIDCIVSLEKYPLTIPEKSGPVNVKLGKVETSVSADITAATTHTYYFAPVKINPVYWNSFLDYEPYTHFELYIPFCGTVTLSPRDILNRNLSVNLIVDFTTGTCVAYVLSDGLVIETVNGKISIAIPVTGIDSTTIASQITNGILNTRNARYTHQFTTLSKIASPSGLIGNVYNLWGSAQSVLTSETNAKAAEYDLTHQDAPPHIIGSASPVGSWAIDFKCRLLIYYPTGDVIDNSKQYPNARFNDTVLQHYLNTVGVATVEPGVIGSYRGLLIGTKINLDGMTTANGRPATAEELQMIAEAIETGIII